MLQEIIWIFEKEFRYALRDTDVLLYSLLVPLLIYPGILLAASEVMLWQMNEAQHNFRVSVQDTRQLSPHLLQALKGVEGVKITPSTDPQHDLSLGKIDAYIVRASEQDKNTFVTYVGNKKGVLAANKVNEALVVAQTAAQQAAYKKYNVPADLLRVCTVNETRLIPFNRTQTKVESQAPLGILGLLLLGVLQIGLTSGVTSVCVFAEEKEKKTFETTLSLPVPSYVHTAGKWLAASILSLISGVANIIAVGGTIAVVLLQAHSMQKISWPSIVKVLFSTDLPTVLLAVIILIVCAGLSCALCLLFVSACKNFKDGQAIVTYPMISVITLPMLAFIPGLEQTFWIYLIPFTNLLVCFKHPQGSSLNLVWSLLESMIIMSACLYFAGKVFFSEKSVFISGGGASPQRPHTQAESI